MSDLTDEDIARAEQLADFCNEEFWSLLAEVKRHRATMKRLEAWADQLCEEAIGSANVGLFIAAELRNRMKGA